LVACPKGIVKPKYMDGVVENEELEKIENKFERFRQQIMGHFSNKKQVENEPVMREPEQEFIITPIFKNRPNEFWVYMEYFSPGLIDRPLDQRIEQYVRIQRDTFRMEVYYLAEPEKYINEWKKDIPFEKLSRKRDLIRDENCDLYIVPDENKRYHFNTVPPLEISCDMKGSSGSTKFVDLFFNLSDAGYNMRFKFYNQDKKLLRETNRKGINFDRLDYRDKDYPKYDMD
jgi:hypothetical protein